MSEMHPVEAAYRQFVMKATAYNSACHHLTSRIVAGSATTQIARAELHETRAAFVEAEFAYLSAVGEEPESPAGGDRDWVAYSLDGTTHVIRAMTGAAAWKEAERVFGGRLDELCPVVGRNREP